MDKADRTPPQTREGQHVMKVPPVKDNETSDRIHGLIVNNQVASCEVSGRDLPTFTYIVFIAMRGGLMVASDL